MDQSCEGSQGRRLGEPGLLPSQRREGEEPGEMWELGEGVPARGTGKDQSFTQPAHPQASQQ